MRKQTKVLFLTVGLSLVLSASVASAAKPPHSAAKPDSDMQAVLDAQASLNPKPIETLSAQEARQQPSPADGVKLVLQKKGKNPNDPMQVTTKDIMIPGAGGDIAARIYTPKGANIKKPLPVIVYYHGGGWVIADINTYDATPRMMAHMVNAIVVSAEYRHAPEFKFPAAHDDAYAAYQWVLANAPIFGGDPKRIAVMGESAGGNLAINTAIAARDNKIQMPVYEVLIYPVAGVDTDTPSYKENVDAKPLNKPMMLWFFKQVIKDDNDKNDPRLDVVDKANLSGLPPTTLIADQIDPLRSEDQALAQKLQQAGVTVDFKTYTGVTHEFFGMGAVVSKAKTAEKVVVKDLRNAFSSQ